MATLQASSAGQSHTPPTPTNATMRITFHIHSIHTQTLLSTAAVENPATNTRIQSQQ
jgi:hypothetical protein